MIPKGGPDPQVRSHCLREQNFIYKAQLLFKCLTPQKRCKHVLTDDVAVTFLSALQSTASLLSVLLSLSPVEVGIAKADCQTVDVLSMLSGFTGLHRLLDE